MSWASAHGGSATPVLSGPRRTSGRGTVIVQGLLTTVTLVVGYSVVTVLAYLTTGPSGNVTAFAVMQTLVGLLVVVYLTRSRTVSTLRRGVPALPSVVVAGLLAYVVVPSSWTGSALFWWRLLDPGPLTFALDLPVWLAAVGLGVLWGASQQTIVRPTATPYG